MVATSDYESGAEEFENDNNDPRSDAPHGDNLRVQNSVLSLGGSHLMMDRDDLEAASKPYFNLRWDSPSARLSTDTPPRITFSEALND